MSAPTVPRGTLYLVPNLLGVVPPAAVLPQGTIDIARRLEHYVVETPKAARQFLKALHPQRALQAIDIVPLDEHATYAAVAQMLAPALAGEDIGLMSDAGCPGVADPGANLVRAAHRADVRVTPLVGPSAVLLALMASGMNGQQFAFHGYLAVKPDQRTRDIETLDNVCATSGATQIFIETPYRNAAIFAATLAACRPTTCLCVAVDLTLPSEEVRCRSIMDWRRSPAPALARRPALFLLGR
ncbi:MAG: SAM-dependent methyltransferase [Betaproteobacteria bacterium]|nr:MAG: SAM-dependent methyltransferase [Betaproteobacteria bacterium]